MSSAGLQNHVKLYRAARGWSQLELARQAGISRTEVSAIEIERLVPSVATALALARVLGCRIDDLFTATGEHSTPPEWAWEPQAEQCRYWQAEVGGRTLQFPAEATSPAAAPHDGVFEFGTLRFRRQLPPEQTLVMACCDPAAGLLAAEYARCTDFRLLVIPRSSGEALSLLGDRKVHLAGVHLAKAGRHQGNAAAVKRRLGVGYTLLHVARWQEGLAVAPSVGAASVSAALRAKLRWIGRESGSGARACLDELLPERAPPRRLARDHRGVAEAIRSGWADIGVCVRLVSEEAGLKFFTVRDEAYELCFASADAGDRRIQGLIETIQSESYRRLLAELPGYDVTGVGELVSIDEGPRRRREPTHAGS
ncbi:MAG: substrate-binding domain-containing protein [Planctomycetales bacterium]